MVEKENGEKVNPYCFTCIECHSDQRINPYTNFWVQDGKMPPCKSCGGVVIYIEGNTWEDVARDRAIALQQTNRERGVPS